MAQLDLIVKNGVLVDGRKEHAADIGIRAGKICLIGRKGTLPPADQVIDADGRYILPGLVDSHVHVREPGLTEKEDFSTATQSAAAGGVTTIMCQPTTLPPTATEKAFLERIQLGEAKAFVDFAIQAGVNPEKLDELPRLARHGPASYDIFLMDYPSELACKDDATLWKALEIIHGLGGVSGVYCGDEELKDLYTQQMRSSGRKDLQSFFESRPAILEAIGVARVLPIALELGVRVHIRQVTTKEAVNLIVQVQQATDRRNITFEVTPQHLVMTADAAASSSPFAKLLPPFRSQDDVRALWQAIADSDAAAIATDHAPHTARSKLAGKQDIWEATSGIPGVQTMLPLLLNQVSRGEMTLSQLVRLCCENPARIFGLYPRKGTLSTGADADFVIVDLNHEATIRTQDQYSKAGFTVFDGWKVKGWPRLTAVRGRVVAENGRVAIDRPWGKFVPSTGSAA